MLGRLCHCCYTSIGRYVPLLRCNSEPRWHCDPTPSYSSMQMSVVATRFPQCNRSVKILFTFLTNYSKSVYRLYLLHCVVILLIWIFILHRYQCITVDVTTLEASSVYKVVLCQHSLRHLHHHHHFVVRVCVQSTVNQPFIRYCSINAGLDKTQLVKLVKIAITKWQFINRDMQSVTIITVCDEIQLSATT